MRPPSIPLITHSPYFSIWCPADTLTESWSTHWTGSANALCGLLRIDGKTYRFLGPQPNDVDGVPELKQTALQITPLRTIATLTGPGLELELTFCSPLLMNDLAALSSPASYVKLNVRSTDGGDHAVQAYLDLCGEAAVNDVSQSVQTRLVDFNGLIAAQVGSKDQEILKHAGDGVRIDWGYAYLTESKESESQMLALGDAGPLRQEFVLKGELPKTEAGPAKPVNQGWPVIAGMFDLGTVGVAGAMRTFVVAYDEIQPVQYLGESLRPLWRKYYKNVGEMLTAASDDAEARINACAVLDKELTDALTKAGGEKYAAIAALSYRQAMAAHGLAIDKDGTPLMFSKENSSNGCMGTVDVMYPTAPLFLLMSPMLIEANLEPVLRYAALDRWKWPFAPHDIGKYPLGNGQVYGGGEKTEKNQMPVEESANMLILVAALQHANPESKLAETYWDTLTKWAAYLREKGLDPENQLCTDDFAGHLAHNANLSVKAILGLGCYAELAKSLKKDDDANTYRTAAEEMAKKWIEMAGDGDHTKLAFDKPGTWSQKYNLVWDRILGLKLFPESVAEREVSFYLETQNKYGIALDNRKTWTKLDWTIWSATLATKAADFEALVSPVYRFVNESPDRVPLSDWYFTDTGRQKQFKARSVVGGVFIKMLADPTQWSEWSKKAAKE